MTTPAKQFTLTDSADLKRLEKVMDDATQDTLRFFEAIAEIFKRHIYLITHKDFKSYCNERFPMAFRTIQRHLKSDTIRKQIMNSGDTGVTQKQAELEQVVKSIPQKAIFEVAKSKPEDRPEVVLTATKIADGKPVTKENVQEAVAKLAHRPFSKAPGRGGFDGVYGAGFVAVATPIMGAPSGPLPADAKSSTGNAPYVNVGARVHLDHQPDAGAAPWPPQPKPHANGAGGLTLDGFRAALLRLRVPGTARILFGDAGGITAIERMNYNPQLDQLTIE